MEEDTQPRGLPWTRALALTDDTKNRHDFNNQLAIIHGFAEILLAETASDDPRRPDLVEIHKATVTALALLGRLYPTHAEKP